MLVMDTLRGVHSTGVAVLGPSEKTLDLKVAKLAVNAIDFLQWKPACNIMDFTSNMIMGHNRYATKGAINNVNAHPFDFPNVVGAHNGTLYTRNGLDKPLDFEVDSENLYFTLDNTSLSELYPKLDGAVALTYFDKRDGTINLIRNHHRPLHYTFSTNRKTLFWASEPWMLEGALSRNRIEHTEIISCEEHTHYSFLVDKAYTEASIKPFDKITVRKLEGYKPKKVVALVQNKVVNNKGTINEKKPAGAGRISTRGPSPSLRGKKVEFFFESFEVRHGKSYLNCTMVDDLSVEVRVYARKGSETYDLIADCASTFSGTVEGVYPYGVEPYITVSCRTVKDTGEFVGDLIDLEEGAKAYLGPNGELITFDAAQEALSEGCVWCNQATAVSDIESVTWVNQGTGHVCCDCATNPEVKQYISDY